MATSDCGAGLKFGHLGGANGLDVGGENGKWERKGREERKKEGNPF